MKKYLYTILFILVFSSITKSQNYNITFSVNMSQFAGTFDTVYVSGTWNNWSGNGQRLIKQGNSNIWQGTFSIPTGIQEFKFTLDNWNDAEIFVNPLSCTKTTGPYTNRVFIATGNATLPNVCWQSCDACIIPITSLQDTIIAYKVDSVLLDGGANYSSYLWSNGDTTRTIWVKNNAKINLRVSNNQYGLTYGYDSTVVIFIKGIKQKDTTVCSGSPLFLSDGSNISDISNSLVAHFPFNGNANDASGNGNNGTNFGATLINDRFGNANSAYSFNGLNNYIQIPNSTSLSISNQITIASWFNINSYNFNYFPILCKSLSASNHGLFNLGLVPNSIYSYLNGQGGGLSVSNINLNQWYHLVTTIGNGTISYYLNGVLIGNQNCQSQPGGIGGPISSDPLIIGKDVPGQTEWTNGRIDDIAIWNKVLTLEDVKSIYNNGWINSKVRWSTGDSSNSIKVIPLTTTTYTCAISIGSFSFTDSIKITVKQTPKANFTINGPDVQCFKGNSFNFVDISNDSGLVTNRYWYFGDDSFSTDSNVSKSFQIDTIIGLRYSNWLIKVANNGCSDTIIKTVDVWPTPKASYTVDKYSQCFKGNAFSFTDTSAVPSGPIARHWDFGDGSFSTMTNPTTSYQSSSSFKVTLTVTAFNNCSDTLSKNITVNPNPQVGFTINKDTQCINRNSFNLTDTTKIASGTFSKLWNLGTSVIDTSSKSILSKVYTTVNSYNIKYIATSNFGCIDSIEKTVTVLPNPNPAGQIAGKVSDLITATPYLYNINQQTGVTYYWIVENAAIVTGQGTNAVTIQWINNGLGKLTVVIMNPSGCTDTSTISVGVGAQLGLVSFNPTSAKSGEVVTINGFNLNNATAVKFGGVTAQSINVISSSKIEAIVGNGSTGDVTVITPNGNVSLAGFTFIPTTGLFSKTLLSGLKIYPNPTKESLTIDFGNIQTQGNVMLEIHDVLGRLVHHDQLNEQTLNEHTISVSGLSTGNYILTLKTNDKIEHVKFVKE